MKIWSPFHSFFLRCFLPDVCFFFSIIPSSASMRNDFRRRKRRKSRWKSRRRSYRARYRKRLRKKKMMILIRNFMKNDRSSTLIRSRTKNWKISENGLLIRSWFRKISRRQQSEKKSLKDHDRIQIERREKLFWHPMDSGHMPSLHLKVRNQLICLLSNLSRQDLYQNLEFRKLILK